MKRRYRVVLTSDDVTSEQTFYLTDYGRDLLLEVAAAFNAAARFSVDHRMYVEPAAQQGDAA